MLKLYVETQLEEYSNTGWNIHSLPIKKNLFKQCLKLDTIKIKVMSYKNGKAIIKLSRPLIMYGTLQNKIRLENNEYSNMNTSDQMNYNRLKIAEYKEQSIYTVDNAGDCLFTVVPVDFQKSVLRNPYDMCRENFIFYLREVADG